MGKYCKVTVIPFICYTPLSRISIFGLIIFSMPLYGQYITLSDGLWFSTYPIPLSTVIPCWTTLSCYPKYQLRVSPHIPTLFYRLLIISYRSLTYNRLALRISVVTPNTNWDLTYNNVWQVLVQHWSSVPSTSASLYKTPICMVTTLCPCI